MNIIRWLLFPRTRKDYTYHAIFSAILCFLDIGIITFGVAYSLPFVILIGLLALVCNSLTLTIDLTIKAPDEKSNDIPND